MGRGLRVEPRVQRVGWADAGTDDPQRSRSGVSPAYAYARCRPVGSQLRENVMLFDRKWPLLEIQMALPNIGALPKVDGDYLVLRNVSTLSAIGAGRESRVCIRGGFVSEKEVRRALAEIGLEWR